MSDMGKVLNKLSGVAVQAKKKIVDLSSSILKPVMNVTTGPVVTLVESRPFAEQVTKDNTIYVVKYDFNLAGANVVLPKGCTLEFRGGAIRNGVLTGTDSTIHGDRKIFYDVSVEGMWNCVGNVGWWAVGNPIVHNEWGYVMPDLTDQSGDIQRALNSSFRELHFPPQCFYLGNTLELTKEKRLVLHGSDMKLNMEQTGVGKQNTTILFSDKNICLLRIAVNENTQNAIVVEGGSFDVSKCENYTQNCIEVRADEEGQRLWGLTLNTNVKGKYNQTTGIGININPVENKEMTGNKAYVTQVRIKSNISNFGLGIKARSYGCNNPYETYNWCSDVVIDGCITNCPVAVDCSMGADVRSMIQSGKFWDIKENGVALIKVGGDCSCVSSNIYDIRMQNSYGWSNEYAVEVVEKKTTLVAYGRFEAFYKACERLGWPVVKGRVVD